MLTHEDARLDAPPAESGQLGDSDSHPEAQPPPGRVSSRVTLIVQVYHRTPHGPPLAVRDGYGWTLVSEEPAYVRPAAVARMEWQPLDLGWLKDQPIDMILVSNDEGRTPGQVIPTAEEAAALEGRVLEVSFGGDSYPALSIRPQMTLPLCPTDPSSIRIRGRGPVRFTVTVIPG